jgi:hypothetical protein
VPARRDDVGDGPGCVALGAASAAASTQPATPVSPLALTEPVTGSDAAAVFKAMMDAYLAPGAATLPDWKTIPVEGKALRSNSIVRKSAAPMFDVVRTALDEILRARLARRTAMPTGAVDDQIGCAEAVLEGAAVTTPESPRAAALLPAGAALARAVTCDPVVLPPAYASRVGALEVASFGVIDPGDAGTLHARVA